MPKTSLGVSLMPDREITPAMTYGSYLKLPELLSLQEQASDPEEHDELLFIVIHQVYELWFKEILHELDEFVEHLDDDRQAQSGHQLRRVLRILKTLISQMDVLETMTPLEFKSFRSFLNNSSGFQSAQFREIEFLLGFKSEAHIAHLEGAYRVQQKVHERFGQPSIWDTFMRYLDRQGFNVPSEVLERDFTNPPESNQAVQEVLIDIYQNHPAVMSLCEMMLDLDEGVQEWRYRHVMMVQRTIGTLHGTGGSDGVAYLRTTLFNPAFPDLWAIRSLF